MCTCGHIEESFLLTLLHFVLIFKSTQPISNWETRRMLSVLISYFSALPMLNLLRVVCVTFSWSYYRSGILSVFFYLFFFFFLFLVNFTGLDLHKKIKILGRQHWKRLALWGVLSYPWSWGKDCWFCAQPWAGFWVGITLFEHQGLNFRCNKSSSAAIKRTYRIPEQSWNNSGKVVISFLNPTLTTSTFMEHLHPLACSYALP